MSELVLTDLYSQREAVVEYVKGWQPLEILSWMRLFGSVIEPGDGVILRLYTFRSGAGIEGHFYFRGGEELVIVDSGWLT
jgi:hypothetical protein